MNLTSHFTTPGHRFGSRPRPQAPDYSNPESWAAFPGRASRAGSVPPGTGTVAAGDDAPVDTFFIHPTTYFWSNHWNAPIEGRLGRAIVGATLAGQASAFNGVSRVYAPYYRQMTLSGFRRADVRSDSLDFAYQDVRRAFLRYLETYARDRPVIVAGHSQGSRLALRLVEEFFGPGELRDRLVAAFIVGAKVWSGPYDRGEPRVPIADGADQTGCIVTWRTFEEGADESLDDNPGEIADGRLVCVNPISWTRDKEPAPARDNLGSIQLPMLRGPQRPLAGLTGARCDNGVVRIAPLLRSGFRVAHAAGNWHAYDYALFYMNVRANAAIRVRAYLERERPEKVRISV